MLEKTGNYKKRRKRRRERKKERKKKKENDDRYERGRRIDERGLIWSLNV